MPSYCAPLEPMEFYLQLAVSLLIASLILFIIFKTCSSSSRNSRENSLNTKRKGKTVLITGPTKSGKTVLFQKLADAPKLLQTVHSLKPNFYQLGSLKLVDLPQDDKTLHSKPADYFHYNDLAGLIICLNQTDTEALVVVTSFVIGILKNVPLCVMTALPKDSIQSSLIKTLNNLQNSRLSTLLSSTDTVISFDDPINRLVFESEEGEVAAEYESKVREYFDEKVTICDNDHLVKEWIQNSNL